MLNFENSLCYVLGEKGKEGSMVGGTLRSQNFLTKELKQHLLSKINK